MKIVVVGHGMVGQKFLESLGECAPCDAEVTVLCEEPRPAYDRVHLSEFFNGRSAADLSLVPQGFFERTEVHQRIRGDHHVVCRRMRAHEGHQLALVQFVVDLALARLGEHA